MITNPNDPSRRFADDSTTKRRRGVWAVGVVFVLTGALAIGYLATVDWNWRGALHLADSITDEAVITARIESELAWSKEIEAGAIDVTTQGGVVRLRGTVPSDDARRLAVDIAKNADGVERVEDQLLVENVDQPETETDNERS